MSVFFLTTLAHASEGAEEAQFGWVQIFMHAGWFAWGTIGVLILMVLASLIVSVERLIAFERAKWQSRRLAAAIVKNLQTNDVGGALKVVRSDSYKVSYLGALLRSGLKEVYARQDQYGVQNAKRAVDKAAGIELTKMRRGMSILATTGATAPFVGLVGTTVGVINAFQGMATEGSGLASISAGISEALITTAFGIGVAVVGVWAFNYFNGRIDKVADELQASTADFLDWASKLVQPEAAPHAKAGK